MRVQGSDGRMILRVPASQIFPPFFLVRGGPGRVRCASIVEVPWEVPGGTSRGAAPCFVLRGRLGIALGRGRTHNAGVAGSSPASALVGQSLRSGWLMLSSGEQGTKVPRAGVVPVAPLGIPIYLGSGTMGSSKFHFALPLATFSPLPGTDARTTRNSHVAIRSYH